jgi:hypothetical protein
VIDDRSALTAHPAESRRRFAERIIPATIVVCQFLLAAPGGHYYYDAHLFASAAHEVLPGIRNGDAAALYELVKHPYDARAGRVWPLTRPYFAGLYAAFGEAFWAWQLWYCALLVLTTQLIYTFTRRLTERRFAPLGATLLFVLYFPASTVVHSLVWLETPIAPLLILGLLMLVSMERAALRSDSRRVRRAACLAGLAIVATLGLKETSIAFIPPILFILISYVSHGPRRLRAASLTLAACIAAFAGILAWKVLGRSIGSGWYTRSYDPSDLSVLLSNIEWWRQSLLTIYGPLPIIWLSAVAVRTSIALADRKWTSDSTWRLALAAIVMGTIAVVSPKPIQNHYYLGASLACIAVGIAWECCDLAEMMRVRTHRRRGSDPDRWLVWALAIAVVATWCLPLPGDSDASTIMSLKVCATFFSALLLGIVIGRERWRIREIGGPSTTAARFANAVGIYSLFHLTLFAVPNVFLVPYFERMRYDSLEAALSYLIDHVPPSGRVATIWAESEGHDADEVVQIETHVRLCRGRNDLRFKRFGAQINPEDYVLAPGLRPANAGLHFPSRARVTFTTSGLVYRPDQLQPARLCSRWLHGEAMSATSELDASAPTESAAHRSTLFYPYFAGDRAIGWHRMTRTVYLPSVP